MPEVAAQKVTLRDVALSFDGRQRLDIPALDLSGGGPTILMGPNGAGKSLLLRAIHGLIRLDQGQVDAGAMQQAMVFQKPVLLRRSVAENLKFVLKRKGLNGREQAGELKRLLQLANLENRAHQPARRLSGGEQQRLALARALAMRPDLLLLDEPTASLDPTSTREIEDLIQTATKAGTWVAMVTHDVAQARRLGRDLVFLHRGQVVAQGTLPAALNHAEAGPLATYLSGDLLD